MYDAKSLLKTVDDFGTKSKLPPNKQLVFLVVHREKR